MEKIIIEQNSNRVKKNLMHLKARICAYLAGDGYVAIVKGRRHTYYEVNFYPDNYSTLVAFVEAFRYVYGKEPLVYRHKNKRMYYVRCRNKKICTDLLSITKFKSLEWTIPLKLLKDRESKKEWLRAFFDCESHIAKKQIQLQSVNLIGLRQIQRLLKSFSIESKLYKYERKNRNWNTNYILSIMKRESRKKYLNEISFNHSDKKEKLALYINAGVGQSGSPLVSN